MLGVKAQLVSTPPRKNSIYLGKSDEVDKELNKNKSTARIQIPLTKNEDQMTESGALCKARVSESVLNFPT